MSCSLIVIYGGFRLQRIQREQLKRRFQMRKAK
jgi:hypothetical protein